MNDVEELKKEIAALKKRNRRVEADKAWETSWIRRSFIAVSTYILIALFMYFLRVERPFVSAIIPTIGYLLSTISLRMLKGWFVNRYNS